MPNISTLLFTITILVVILCQSVARHIHFESSTSSNDLVFMLIFLFCASGILTIWLGKPVKPKPEDDSDSSNNNDKNPPHDTTL